MVGICLCIYACDAYKTLPCIYVEKRLNPYGLKNKENRPKLFNLECFSRKKNAAGHVFNKLHAEFHRAKFIGNGFKN